MDFIIKIIIISLIVISFILVNNRRKINLFFEKEFILKLLLFAVCLFIKTEKNKNRNILRIEAPKINSSVRSFNRRQK